MHSEWCAHLVHTDYVIVYSLVQQNLEYLLLPSFFLPHFSLPSAILSCIPTPPNKTQSHLIHNPSLPPSLPPSLRW